jgi:hypothetical protein
MLDISRASWEDAQTDPLKPSEQVRAGALFLFDGTIREILVVTPNLQYVGEHEDELMMIFSGYDATLMDGLKMITGPTFVIVHIDYKLGGDWEQGYQILDVTRFRRLEGNEIGVRMKVRKGRPT